jgi:hypothetical protein
MPIKNLVISILAICPLVACIKYSDALNFSLKNEEARLARKWQVQTAHYSLFTDQPAQGEDQTYIWKNLKIEIKKDKSYLLENYNLDQTEKTIETGSWEFTDDLKMLKTTGLAKRYDVESNALLSEAGKNTT